MKASPQISIASLADGLGLLSSTVCVIHCVAMPAVLVAGNSLPGLLGSDEFFHRALLWAVLPAAVVAFGIGCLQHKDRLVLILGALGFVGLTLSAAVLHDFIGETGERAVSLVSAAVLIAAHVRNFRLCRSGGCDHEKA